MMIKKALLTAVVISLAGGAALAAGPNGATLSADKRITTVPQGSAHYSSLPPKKGSVIFSNVGTKYPKGLYFCCYGNTISGPDSQAGGPYSVALQFTPDADVKAKEIDAGVGWVNGTNSVTLSLYKDNGGQPGDLIASAPATGLGSFGDCCTMATASIKASLKGGTPYWVGVSAEGNTWAAWAFNSTDQIDVLNGAYSSGSGWSTGGAIPAPSFQVLGK